jgi:hypothetical protein
MKTNYTKVLADAFAAPVTAERPSGCGRVYVCISSDASSFFATPEFREESKAVQKAHIKGLKAACKALGKIFQTKSHYGDRNAIYVGYDNATGYELGRGTAIVNYLKSQGIDCYRNEHGD